MSFALFPRNTLVSRFVPEPTFVECGVMNTGSIFFQFQRLLIILMATALMLPCGEALAADSRSGDGGGLPRMGPGLEVADVEVHGDTVVMSLVVQEPEDLTVKSCPQRPAVVALGLTANGPTGGAEAGLFSSPWVVCGDCIPGATPVPGTPLCPGTAPTCCAQAKSECTNLITPHCNACCVVACENETFAGRSCVANCQVAC